MPIEFKTLKHREDGVPEIQPQEVFEKRAELNLIDVRTPGEYSGELGHAPGSQLIELQEIPDALPAIPTDKTIVFICRSGGRSAQATQIAKSLGVTDCYNMKGGMLLWNELNLATEGQSAGMDE